MSNTIPLNPEVIGLYRHFLEHPEKHGCNYKPLKEVFKETDKYIPQDKLYKKYLMLTPWKKYHYPIFEQLSGWGRIKKTIRNWLNRIGIIQDGIFTPPVLS